MSLATTTRKAGPYAANGATAFPFAFKVFQPSDILVVQTDTAPTDNTLVLNTDYTVTLNPNQDSNPGGTVNLTAAPPTGYLITLGSQVQQIQSVTLTNNGGFYPSVINNALDYLTILIQQLSEKVNRALTMPFSTGASGQLPPVSPGSLLGWKADGTGIANVGATGVGAGGIVASNMAGGATGTALSADTQAAATKATPVDADKIPLFDSANFWYLKGLTWANLKATLLTYLKTAFSTLVGTQFQVSADLSPLWEGTQSTLTSGAAYALNGNILIMKARTHNTQIDSSGNFTGVSETGIATAEFWGEDDVIRVFTAPSVSAGTVPAFGATPTYQLDMKSGASALNSVMPAAFKNLKIVASGLTNTSAVVTADKVIVENASGSYYGIENLNLTVSSAASGANGLDTGVLAANTWYAVWAIYSPSTGTAAGLLSLSSTAPTLPTGYTYQARLGWVRTDGTANKYLLQTLQYGRRAQYLMVAGSNVAAYPTMASGVAGAIAGTWAAVATGSFVPPSASKIAFFGVIAGGAGGMMVAPNNQSAQNYEYQPYVQNTGAPGTACASPGEFLLESANIYWASNLAGAMIQCLGWEDDI